MMDDGCFEKLGGSVKVKNSMSSGDIVLLSTLERGPLTDLAFCSVEFYPGYLGCN